MYVLLMSQEVQRMTTQHLLHLHLHENIHRVREVTLTAEEMDVYKDNQRGTTLGIPWRLTVAWLPQTSLFKIP